MESTTKQRCFTHLSYEERVKVELLQQQGESIKAIARILHRSPGCIHYELKRKRVAGCYEATKAHQKTYQKRYWSKWQSYKGVRYEPLIREKLLLRWSPERISGWLKRQGITISPKAVYKFVHSRCLERYLWKPRHRKQRLAAYLHDARKFTDLEPVFTTGHWECDFIVSSHSSCCLLVAVDRWSRVTVVQKLENKAKAAVLHAFQFLHDHVMMKTVTTDNDIAFGCWRELEQQFGFRVFFTHPYRSWEKPLVEETNQQIRRFVPKGTNLRLVSDRKLNEIHRFLNQTPRQCLGYKTAYEVYEK